MDPTGRVLVVADEINAASLAQLLRDEGYEVKVAADAPTALGACESFGPQVVVTELVNCIELVQNIRNRANPAAVVVMTAPGEVSTAVAAMRAGAAHYLTKPIHFGELVLVLERVFEGERLRGEARDLRERVRERVAPGNIVGTSRPMQRVFEMIDQVAPSRATVLISGESGTGKELVANAIHQRSPRANGPFIRLHCAALAESLLESELFGQERGSITGRKDGRLELADSGTLFLDEIAEVSPTIQVKLMRFLQERELERVGGTQPVKVDVRLIAATSRNLTEEVAKGRFRQDLYYRLNVVALEMPPLRDRRSDIPALARFFLDRYTKETGKTLEGIAPQDLERMQAYAWPGNVRELETVIQGAVVRASGTTVDIGPLPTPIEPTASPPGVPRIPGGTMAELERYAILETLKATRGSTSKAAEILRISVRTIQYRLHEYNVARSGGAPVRKHDQRVAKN